MNFFTELIEGLAISWSAIRANKLRSVLTTLGIVIGIVTVTLMGTAIQGVNNSFMGSISSIGADVLYIDRYGWFLNSRDAWLKAARNPNVSFADLDALQSQMTLAQAIAPTASDYDTIKYGKRTTTSAPILGTTEDYQFTSGIIMAEGHFLTSAECDGGRPVCVLGANLATNLFQNVTPIGEKVIVDKYEFEVVGVMDKQGGFSEQGGADSQIIVPLRQFIRRIWSNPPLTIQVKAASLDQLPDAKEELRSILRRTRHIAPGDSDNFAINQQDQFLEMFHRVAGTIAGIGIFITGLSLFVGGIGIMNIMFVSVAERTREIGVRKAIGAKNRTILLQFIIEAACICVIGGIIALLIAWPATLLLKKAMPAEMSPLVVLGALVAAAVTGILSGFFPAWRAARMNPVDALRNE
jgi:putative ABC transport system permease protein